MQTSVGTVQHHIDFLLGSTQKSKDELTSDPTASDICVVHSPLPGNVWKSRAEVHVWKWIHIHFFPLIEFYCNETKLFIVFLGLIFCALVLH